MVSPKLILLYTSTWKPIMKGGGCPTGVDMIRFIETLPLLREALSCTVCRDLLSGKELFSTNDCDHFVCKDCKGKDREGNRCESCGDWNFYNEDDMLKLLLRGYGDFCRFFLRTRECTRLLEVKDEVDPMFDGLAFLDLLQEGSRLHRTIVKKESPTTRRADEELEVASALNIRQASPSSKNKDANQVVQVTLNKEHPIDIKIEPVFEHPDEEDDMEQEIQVNEIEIQNEPSTMLFPQDPLEEEVYDDLEDDEIVEDDEEEEEIDDENEEDEEEFEEIRTSSLIASPTPPPPVLPPPPPTFAFPTSITIQRPNITTQPMVSTQQMHITPRQVHSFVLTRPIPSQHGQPQLQGARFPTGTSTIRFARLSLDGRPLTMVRHVLSNASATGVRHTVTLPLSAADLMKKKIIVRPGNYGSSPVQHSTAQIQQRWPDASKVLQYASGATSVISQGTVQQQQQQKIFASTSTSSVPHTLNSSMETRPQNITKISLGNMASSGGTVASVNINRPTTLTTPSGKIIGTIGTVVRSDVTGGPIKKLKVRLPKTKLQPKIRRGCRCGNAATQPGKLTCCGQRCPCYVDAKSCTDCKCRGCRNPHLPGGKKLLQGINAVIDTKTNTTVPFSVSVASVSGATTPTSIINSVPITPSSTSTMNLVATTSAPQIFTRIHHPGTSGTSTTTTFSQLIPLANFAGFSIPISLISPATTGHTIPTIQTHPDTTIRIQNVPTITNTNIKHE